MTELEQLQRIADALERCAKTMEALLMAALKAETAREEIFAKSQGIMGRKQK